MPRRRRIASALAVLALLTLPSCGRGEAVSEPTIGGSAFDYQLGGAYPPPDGVGLVVRDRTASPAPGVVNVCYVNGFQTQPRERGWWLSRHPDLLLRGADGEPVVDPAWPDELVLDVSTPAHREAIAEIVGDWIDGCAGDGYDAVATIALFAGRGHAAGLLVGQKNSVQLLARRAEMGDPDFAVSEECNRFEECDAFVDAYGAAVLVVEYDNESFSMGCKRYAGELAIVRRDLDLTAPSEDAYVYDRC
jgi:hypothetical protein